MGEGNDRRASAGGGHVGVDGEQQFTGQVGKHEVSLDGSAGAARRPFRCWRCRSRVHGDRPVAHPLPRSAPRDRAANHVHRPRSPTEPKRFTHVRLDFVLSGEMQPEHVERAIQLSRDKYCSVWSTFRQDIGLEVGYVIE